MGGRIIVAAMDLRSLALIALLASISLPHSYVSAQSSERLDAEARTLFGLGNAAYQEGRYRAALDYFQQAYDLSHRPQLLFNVGQAADRLREDRRALEAFETYLEQVPESPDREAIVARVAILRETLGRSAPPAETTVAPLLPAEASQPETTPPVQTTTTSESSSGSSLPGVLIAGGGGALVVVGVVFLALGAHDASSVEGATDGTPYSDVASAYDRAPTRITVGSVLAGVGVAATATGIVLALRGRRGSSDEASLRLQVQPMGLSLRGTF